MADYKRRKSLRFEQLESRDVMATFGVPWPDAHRLTISFVPDGTQLGSGASDLFATLDAQMPRDVWQGEILRAFQTWASAADVDFAVVSDDGSPLGTSGLAQHDPRFGDIRIAGGHTSSGVIAFGVPYNPVAGGTWAGDVVFGDSANYTKSPTDLFSIALHEAGHVLGLDGSDDALSAMYDQAITSHTALSPTDVSNVTSLYGARVTANMTFHSTMSQAVSISPYSESIGVGYTGSVPLVAYGQLNRLNDASYFKFDRPLGYNGPITVRLETEGISLLQGRISVFDAKGNLVASDVQNADDASPTVTLSLSAQQSRFYIRIEGAAPGVTSVGRFAIGIAFDQVSTMTTERLVEILKLPLDGLSKSDIEKALEAPDDFLINDDSDSTGSNSSAQTLKPLANDPFGRHYRVIGSVSERDSIDIYRIDAPKIAGVTSGVLTLSVRGFDTNAASTSVVLLDDKGNRVPSRVLANGAGIFTIQATGVNLGRSYFVRVTGQAGARGNYELSADVGTTPTITTDFAAGQLTNAAPSAQFNMIVAEDQVFQFLMSADSPTAPAGSTVRFELRDEAGSLVATFDGKVGQTVSGPSLLLRAGNYILTMEVPDSLGPSDEIAFTLFGTTLDDPVGPSIVNPTTNPVAPIKQTYTYSYFINGKWVTVSYSYYIYPSTSPSTSGSGSGTTGISSISTAPST